MNSRNSRHAELVSASINKIPKQVRDDVTDLGKENAYGNKRIIYPLRRKNY